MNREAIFITDEKKLNLTQEDLFDRIINLKLTCFNQATLEREAFVIRSDYEMVYSDANIPIDGTIQPDMGSTYVIRRCTQKPSIRVQCKMVSTNTGINVHVYVNNFFMLTKDGKHIRSFNNSQYVIETVEIAMGYWGQFKRTKEEGDMTYDEFYNVEAKRGADKITIVAPIVVTMDKLPPDSTLHIKGYVAGIWASPVAVSQITTASLAGKHPIISSEEGIAELMYRGITRRYLNDHYFTEDNGEQKKISRRLYKVSEDTNTYFPVHVKYDKVTGLLDTEDADKYGVKVYLSDKVKELEIPKIKDSDGNEQPKQLTFELGWTIGYTVARISAFLQSDIEYTFNSSGDMLLYLTGEVNDPESLYWAFEKQKVYEKTVAFKEYQNQLPAVYNINVDAVATIVCPFFTFIQPFQRIEFASRYALTSIVSYFASYSATVYAFQAINATISFATVDDINEVQITAVAHKDNMN